MKMLCSKKRLFLFLFILSMVVVTVIRFIEPSQTTAIYCRYPERTLILDAGHGGEDGGAVALSGTPESTINLSIVLKIDQLCGLYGVKTRLVRSEDTSLADKDADTIRKKKRSDLMNRVKLVNDTENAVLLSVHQNNYPSAPSSHGAQVFFHDDLVSQQWAGELQSVLRETLDPRNQRQATLIPDNVYLMNHIHCRALLVECGFLSNRAENALLETDSYQSKLAAILTSSYLCFEYQGESLE